AATAAAAGSERAAGVACGAVGPLAALAGYGAAAAATHVHGRQNIDVVLAFKGGRTTHAAVAGVSQAAADSSDSDRSDAAGARVAPGTAVEDELATEADSAGARFGAHATAAG